MLAGLAGGGAEIGWIALYAQFSNGQADSVARGVAGMFFPTLAAAPYAVGLGIALHMMLATLLGIGVTLALRMLRPQWRGTAREALAVVAVLAAVWVVNFLLLGPRWSPQFVGLVPYAVSLCSKLLFGIAAAAVLHLNAGARPLAQKEAFHV